MSDRTPDPWIANDKHSGSALWRIETDAPGYPNDGWIIGELSGPDSGHNAEFIVRAVNCHDELVEALKEARRYVEHQIDVAVGPMHAKYAQDDADKIDAALAKAGESSS